MRFLLRLFTWRITLLLTIICLIALSVFSFYGLFTNKFYFFKFDNYIFPLLTIVHFIYLYVIWFKIKEDEIPDPQMRNLEYAMYVILFVYLYKILETAYTLSCYTDYQEYVIPATFLPLGSIIFVLYILLFGLTIITFKHRKNQIGEYDFEKLNKIEPW